MWTAAASVLLLGYLPGALTFRLPLAGRADRAGLPAEERLFWHIVISLAITSACGLGLAAAGSYRYDRLLWLNGALCALLAAVGRRRLRLGSAAPRPGWSALVPAALIGLAFAIFFFVPPSEYIVGGRDPGVYMNEGIQIAQRGTLTVEDPMVAAVPAEFRDLFFPAFDRPGYYSSRFMGFFLLDPDDGTVVGQFPHLYPLWIAVGYGVNGLSGARYVVGLWALLGVVAVYFSGAWLVGRSAAAAGALLLTVHVSQVWFSRYPNSEMLLQVLIFAALLAYSRATTEGNRFFAPVAATLLSLALFAHITAVLAVGAFVIASLLGIFDGRRPQLTFLLPVTAGTLVAMVYFATVLAPYFDRPVTFVRFMRPTQISLIVLGTVAGIGLLCTVRHRRAAAMVRRWLPWVVLGSMWVLAAYAYFLRVPRPGLAAHDAEALRIYTQFYLSPLGLMAALLGLAVVARRSFWRGLGFVATFLVFASFFFYKMRIVPEHFWTARRFVPVVTPAAFLLIGAVALLPTRWRPPAVPGRRALRLALVALGTMVVLVFGYRYFRATMPILNHVEYAGLIPQLEQLNANFEDTDLVIVESRQVSDMHTLALPLAYVYGRNVLVFFGRDPDGTVLRDFFRWARGRYRKVFFVGGSGTQLVSRSTAATLVARARFQVPEWESAFRAYPREVRYKPFDYGVYDVLPRLRSPEGLDLDVGGEEDDLFVRGFHDKERLGGGETSFRWTRDISSVLALGVTPRTRTVTLWLNDGGRPDHLPPATVTVRLNERPLGTVTVTSQFVPFRFEVPPELAEQLAVAEEAGRLEIECAPWNPAETVGGLDTRDVGVMVDRVTIGE